MTLPPGATVQVSRGTSYIVENLLGKGGFGAVYVVRDRRIKSNKFALKELVSQDRRDRDCFVFEGELLKRLDHPALPRVHGMFEHKKAQRMYMLMDYIQGPDLSSLRKEQPEQRFPLPVILDMLAPVVDALVYLHNQHPPIVHRDVKPANIIISAEDEQAILVDFGVSKEYDSEETTTVIRHVTPGYAAPEQYTGGTDTRTDIYGLGATIYTLLTGQSPPDALTRATTKEVEPLQSANLVAPEVPETAARLITRAMSLNSNDRFSTIGEFWQQLQVLVPEYKRESSCKSPSRVPLALPHMQSQNEAVVVQQKPSIPRLKSYPVIASVLLVLLLAVATGAGFLLHIGQFSQSRIQLQTKTSHPVLNGMSSPTPPSKDSLYPFLGASYDGTIGDVMTGEKTNLVLMNIEQNREVIHGLFRGLGLVGSFEGTVTSSGYVQFSIRLYTGDLSLEFEGVIKIGGDMAGSFTVLNKDGLRTGEAGIWNAAPTS